MGALSRWLRLPWSRVIAGAALAVVALVTGRISYSHIEALTLVLHGSPMTAKLMPFGVDGLIVVGSVVLLQSAPGQEWLGWLGLVPGVSASLFANVESGIRYGWLAATWAGVPAVSFALACFMFERWLYMQATSVNRGGSGGSPGPDPEVPSTVLEPAAVSQPEPPEPPTPAAALAALIATGSRRELADFLGVPKSRVDRWAASMSQPGDGGPEVVQGGPEDAPEMAGSLNGGGPEETGGNPNEAP